MLIEKANDVRTLVQLVPYVGMVNPEHIHHSTYVPLATTDDAAGVPLPDVETLFIEDFLRKSDEFRQHEHIDGLPVEIRLGTIYVYQNRRQQRCHPDALHGRTVGADFLRNEEKRLHDDKQFLITLNKNKGINDIPAFEHHLTCAGFRALDPEQQVHRLYLRYEHRRLILELKQHAGDPTCFSVKRLLRYTWKFRHIDVVKPKDDSHDPETWSDVYDVRTSISRAVDEEELHLNDEYCDFLQAKSLDRCVWRRVARDGHAVYGFNRHVLPYFDFFQIKRSQTYVYSCVNSRFFGVRVILEHQTGYDLNAAKTTTTTPYLQTTNVIMAKLFSLDASEHEARRIWSIGQWLSDLATRCTSNRLPVNEALYRMPKR